MVSGKREHVCDKHVNWNSYSNPSFSVHHAAVARGWSSMNSSHSFDSEVNHCFTSVAGERETCHSFHFCSFQRQSLDLGARVLLFVYMKY